jgi:hypothetical protein
LKSRIINGAITRAGTGFTAALPALGVAGRYSGEDQGNGCQNGCYQEIAHDIPPVRANGDCYLVVRSRGLAGSILFCNPYRSSQRNIPGSKWISVGRVGSIQMNPSRLVNKSLANRPLRARVRADGGLQLAAGLVKIEERTVEREPNVVLALILRLENLDGRPDPFRTGVNT